MNPRSDTHLIKLAVRSGWIDAVGKENKDKIIFWVCPGERSGIARVAKTGGTGILRYGTLIRVIFNQWFVEARETANNAENGNWSVTAYVLCVPD